MCEYLHYSHMTTTVYDHCKPEISFFVVVVVLFAVVRGKIPAVMLTKGVIFILVIEQTLSSCHFDLQSTH